MENKKVEKFTNFNYVVLPKSDPKYVDVQVKFKYNGEQAIHVVSFRNVPGKTSAYYIDKAKAKIAHYEKNGRLVKIATKSISASKDTFYQRHKKGVNALLAVAAVGAVAGATAAIVINCMPKPDPTVVTEEEIDNYLEGPTGNTRQISQLSATNILKDAIKNYQENLKDIEVKQISSSSFYEEVISRLPAPNGYNPVPFNDTTGYYTNDALKTKSYFKSYLKGRILEDKQQAKAATIYTKDNYEELQNGVSSSAKVETLSTIKCGPNPETEMSQPIVSFWNQKVSFDDYYGPNLEYAYPDNGFDTRAEAGAAIQRNVKMLARQFVNFDEQLFASNIDQFRMTEDNSLAYLKIEDTYTEYYMTPITYHDEYIWYFKNTGEDGWALDAFAKEGRLWQYENDYDIQSAYVEYNDRGEKLDKPFCINKNKAVTKVSYGALDTDSSIDEVKYDGRKLVTTEGVLDVTASLYDEDGTHLNDYFAQDRSLIRRIENPDFYGFDLHCEIDFTPQIAIGDSFDITISDYKANQPTTYGYNELEKYLDKGLFKGNDDNRIEFKKNGTFAFDLILNENFEIDNLIVDFREGGVTSK